MDERETIRCPHCTLNQFKTATGNCRRCGKELAHYSVEETDVYLKRNPAAPTEKPTMRTMRQVMQSMAVYAVKYIGHTTKAAAALEIPHSRLKQLLREAGDEYGRDRRYDGKRVKP